MPSVPRRPGAPRRIAAHFLAGVFGIPGRVQFGGSLSQPSKIVDAGDTVSRGVPTGLGGQSSSGAVEHARALLDQVWSGSTEIWQVLFAQHRKGDVYAQGAPVRVLRDPRATVVGGSVAAAGPTGLGGQSRGASLPVSCRGALVAGKLPQNGGVLGVAATLLKFGHAKAMEVVPYQGKVGFAQTSWFPMESNSINIMAACIILLTSYFLMKGIWTTIKDAIACCKRIKITIGMRPPTSTVATQTQDSHGQPQGDEIIVVDSSAVYHTFACRAAQASNRGKVRKWCSVCAASTPSDQ